MFFIPTKVTLGEVKIGSPDHKSALLLGSNFIRNNNVAAKKNQGFGQQIADFSFTAIPIVITLDNEIIDMPTIKIGR